MPRRSSVHIGNTGEAIAAMVLRNKGLEMVAEMPTPFVRTPRGRIIYKAKVFGDISAIVPGTGQKVLVEVKTWDEPRLKYSALKPHQVQALDDNRKFGGLSLLVWITYGEVHVMQWPIEDLVPQSSLPIEKARLYEWPGISNGGMA